MRCKKNKAVLLLLAALCASAGIHVYCSCTNRCHVSMTVSILCICNTFEFVFIMSFLSSCSFGSVPVVVKAKG